MTDEEWKFVGYRIRDIRRQRGISILELAQIAGICETHLSNIELGKKKASMNTMVDIVRALCVSMDYIVLGIRPQLGGWGLVFRSDDELESTMLMLE